jgi:hypothetical protein
VIVADYIKEKFQSFGITMSEADLFDVCSENGSNELTTSNKGEVELAIVGFIPQLLLRPKSMTEGGYKVDFDVQAIKDYYAFLCKKYTLADMLNSVSTISDASDLW